MKDVSLYVSYSSFVAIEPDGSENRPYFIVAMFITVVLFELIHNAR